MKRFFKRGREEEESSGNIPVLNPEPSDGRPARPPLPEHIARAKKRRAVVTEIKETERSYLTKLEQLLQVYEKPLLDAVEAGKPIITKEKIDMIFGKVPEICSVSRHLLQRLETDDIADSFSFLAPFIHGVYSDYSRTYAAVMKQVKVQTSLNEEFREFLIASSKVCLEGIESLLIMPVQRVPRYKMLLESLIKYTPDEDPERPRLQQALETVGWLASEINENIREYENEQRVIAIGRRLMGKEVPPIAIPGRRIIKEGWLEKRSRQEPGRSNWRYTFLFNDIMVYAVAMEDNFSSTIVGGAAKLGKGVSRVGHTLLPNSIMGKAHELKKQVGKTAANYLESDSPSLTCYMFKKQLQVKELTAAPSPEGDGDWLAVTDGIEGFEFRAESPGERDAWVEAIQAAADDAKNKRNSGISSASATSYS